MPKVYSIMIKGLPPGKVHPTLRCTIDESNKVNVRLTLKGRVASRRSSTAWLPTYELAEDLLAFWRPQLQARWGDFEYEILGEPADKWQRRWMDKDAAEAESLLSKGGTCSTPSKKGSGAPPIATNLLSVLINGRLMYYRGKIRGKFTFSEKKADAKRYVTEQGVERLQSQLPETLERTAKLVRLSEQEALELEQVSSEDMQQYWDFQLGRK